MKIQTFTALLCLLSGSTAFAFAGPKAPPGKTNYAKCNPHVPASLGNANFFVARLNQDGNFDVDPKSKRLASHVRSEDGATETVQAWDNVGSTGTKTTWVLAKKDGRPVSLEMIYDPKNPMLSGGAAGETVGEANKLVSTLASYDYSGNNCFVKQISYKRSRDKDVVSYDHQACKEIMAAAKGMNKTKVSECVKFIGGVEAAEKKAAERVSADNKILHLGYFGLGSVAEPAPKSTAVDILFGPLMSVSSCVTTRQYFGLNVEPDVKELSGMGGGFSGNLDTTKPPKDDDGTSAK